MTLLRYDPYKAYIGVEDQQGRVTLVDDSSQGGPARHGWGEILGFDFAALAPVATSSGLPSGKRQHKPVIVKMKAGLNSLILLQATSRFPRTITLEIVEQGAGGSERIANRITLTNAQIASIGVDLVAGGADGGFLAHRLEIDVDRLEMSQPCHRWCM